MILKKNAIRAVVITGTALFLVYLSGASRIVLFANAFTLFPVAFGSLIIVDSIERLFEARNMNNNSKKRKGLNILRK